MKSEISENRFLGSISTSAIRNLLPSSASAKHKMNSYPTKPSSNSENIPPLDPNIQAHNFSTSLSNPKQLPSKLPNGVTKSESQQQVSAPPDAPVRVVVNINERGDDQTVQKVSDNSLSVEDRTFKFDSVLNSILKQIGSGKTYTMWGPPSAMLEGNSSLQGVVPSIFQMLFSKIQKEQGSTEGKQIDYQCHCSFLEDDPKNGFYVENLTEEYVTSYEDVTQILIKGLSSRKVGATSINSKSSRSHIVFTCIIESWSTVIIVNDYFLEHWSYNFTVDFH